MVSWTIRYLRSPEFVLTVGNLILMTLLFVFEWIELLAEFFFELSVWPVFGPAADFIAIGSFLVACAPFMLPMTWAMLAAAVFDFYEIDSLAPLMWMSVPNSVLWGFGVAFFFRLLRTHDGSAALRATLTWTCGASSLPLDHCPHCGQALPANSPNQGVPEDVSHSKSDAQEVA